MTNLEDEMRLVANSLARAKADLTSARDEATAAVAARDAADAALEVANAAREDANAARNVAVAARDFANEGAREALAAQNEARLSTACVVCEKGEKREKGSKLRN